ncbi:lipocalin-like domain-containing protein [Flexistipes sp.]|uniref:lipocalin-like domain-containing protein n=1 Tax=Flexistipes sp. TaxID=3088135 RepID=UPI002E1F202A|nr:lipocalin-like domain-containing protein [Flexistipes sp.]
MRKFIIVLIALLISAAAYAENYTTLSPDDSVKLNQDLYYRKNFASQWWYLTGHLETEDGRKFGYELTFFAVGVNKKEFQSAFGLNNLFISHFAVTDIKRNEYYQKEEISRGAYGAAGASASRLNVFVYDNVLRGSLNQMHVEAEAENFSIKMDLKSAKRPILNGDNGYSNKVYGCGECASLYFSITDMDTAGVIAINGENYNVSGKSWFDREINSDYNTDKIEGWDWFSIMLDDNRELMIYRIRNRKGKANKSSYAVLIDKNGKKQKLDFSKISLDVTEYFKSEITGSEYPVGWHIRIPEKNIDIKIKPYVKNQEFIATYSTFNYYWEGACSVTGTDKGKAYIELTGY